MLRKVIFDCQLFFELIVRLGEMPFFKKERFLTESPKLYKKLFKKNDKQTSLLKKNLSWSSTNNINKN